MHVSQHPSPHHSVTHVVASGARKQIQMRGRRYGSEEHRSTKVREILAISWYKAIESEHSHGGLKIDSLIYRLYTTYTSHTTPVSETKLTVRYLHLVLASVLVRGASNRVCELMSLRARVCTATRSFRALSDWRAPSLSYESMHSDHYTEQPTVL